MEIKLTTSNKKLTKSIVSQMPIASKLVMDDGEILGYVLNCDKYFYKMILINYDGDVYKIPPNRKKGVEAVYWSIGKWSQNKKFETEKECNEYWASYQNVIKSAKTHIYI